MSDQEQEAAIGRLAKNHAAVRKEAALLDAELSHFADRLFHLCGSIKDGNIPNVRKTLQEAGVVKYFSTDALGQLLHNHQSAHQRLESLQQEMQAAGLL
jgi:uncharacterized protein (DUF2345 family)